MSKQQPSPDYSLYSLARSSVSKLKISQKQLKELKAKLQDLTKKAVNSDQLKDLEESAGLSIFSRAPRTSSREDLTEDLVAAIDKHLRETDILIRRFEQLRDHNYSFGNAVYNTCTIS